MTREEIEEILRRWPVPAAGSRPAAVIAPGRLVRPWDSAPEGLIPRGHPAGGTDCPDFGMRFARWFVNHYRSGRIGRRSRRRFLSRGGRFRWIRHAVKVLERRGEGVGRVWPPTQERVRAAVALNADALARQQLRELLLSAGATCREVAGVLGLDSDTVEAFAELFFNVVDRRREPGYIHGLVNELAAGRDFGPDGAIRRDYARRLEEALHLSSREALERFHPGAAGDGRADTLAGIRIAGAIRQMLLDPDGYVADSRAVDKALEEFRHYEKRVEAIHAEMPQNIYDGLEEALRTPGDDQGRDPGDDTSEDGASEDGASEDGDSG